MTKEQLRHKLSAILMDTCEEKPMHCNIVIGEEQAMGLSSLQMPIVTGAFQLPSEGIIYFNIQGFNEPVEFDDMHKKDLIKILNALKTETKPLNLQ